MTRSIFLKNESYLDVQAALSKAETDQERRHILSERAKANGWTKEREDKFRDNCKTIGFSLPSQTSKTNTVATNVNGGSKSRMLHDAVWSSLRQARILHDKVEE